MVQLQHVVWCAAGVFFLRSVLRRKRTTWLCKVVLFLRRTDHLVRRWRDVVNGPLRFVDDIEWSRGDAKETSDEPPVCAKEKKTLSPSTGGEITSWSHSDQRGTDPPRPPREAKINYGGSY